MNKSPLTHHELFIQSTRCFTPINSSTLAFLSFFGIGSLVSPTRWIGFTRLITNGSLSSHLVNSPKLPIHSQKMVAFQGQQKEPDPFRLRIQTAWSEQVDQLCLATMAMAFFFLGGESGFSLKKNGQ